MNKIIQICFLVLFLTLNIFSAPFDTGFIEWEQPDGTTFTARSWGDEFFHWMETDEGYRIIIGPGEYFYYAELDVRGEFYPSEFKVGIDQAQGSSYQLKRSPQRIAEIEFEISNFNQEVYCNYLYYKDLFNINQLIELRVAIILVDFQDEPLHIGNYYKEYFDSLFFSTDYYFHPVTSPNGQPVFGSYRDYFKDQSINKLDILGKLNYRNGRSILNPIDPNHPLLPKWVYMPGKREDYNNMSIKDFQLLVKSEVILQLGVNNLDDYDAIGFIYAGPERGYSGGTTPGMRNHNIFQTTEQQAMGEFNHIGTGVHEFGHILGFFDQYKGDPVIDPLHWTLMSTGCYNGTKLNNYDKLHNCPAPLDPFFKIEFNWVNTININLPITDLEILYDYSPPKFYKVEIPGSNEYFLLKKRWYLQHSEGYNKYTPTEELSNLNGILIWHLDPSPGFDQVELIFANNNPSRYDGHRFPNPLNETQYFNDNTIPSAKKRNGENSYINFVIEYENNKIFVDINSSAITIKDNVHWDQNMNINVPVIVEEGANLIIDQGVNIIFNDPTIKIDVYGNLIINGSQNSQVNLTSNSNWGGIRLINNGTLETFYTNILNTDTPIHHLNGDNTTIHLNNSNINDNISLPINSTIYIEKWIFKSSKHQS